MGRREEGHYFSYNEAFAPGHRCVSRNLFVMNFREDEDEDEVGDGVIKVFQFDSGVCLSILRCYLPIVMWFIGFC